MAYNEAFITTCPKCGERSDGGTEADQAAAASSRARLAHELQVAAEEAQRSYVTNALDRMQTSLSEGRTPYLHAVEVISVEYSVDGEAGGRPSNVQLMAQYGWDGWEIVGTVPRTTGLSLRNAKSGTFSYGGGVGGLVEGAVVLLRFPVTVELMERRLEVLTGMLERQHARDLLSTVDAELPTLPIGTVPDELLRGAPARGGSGTSFGVGMMIPFGD